MSTASYTLVYTPSGGMLTTQDLRAAAESAVSFGDGRVHISGRQELLLRGVSAYGVERLLKQPNLRLVAWTAERAPAIVTTAASIGLPGSCEWLTRGVLADVSEILQPVVALDVSIADPGQTTVAAMTSQLNVLASTQRDLWHLYLLDSVLSGAIRTQDLPAAVCCVQRLLLSEADVSAIAEAVRPHLFNLDAVPLPGVLAYAADPSALLFSCNSEGISAQFLIALCVLVADAGGATISLTPWRALCVTGLDEAATRQVDLQVMRHRAEVNLPWGRFTCSEALESLAHRIREVLAATSPYDARMSWALVEDGDALPEAHVVIQCVRCKWWRRGRYNVFVREGLTARAGAWRRHVEGLLEGALPQAIIDALTTRCGAPSGVTTHPVLQTAATRPAHRCRECLSEYSAEYGDPVGGISVGTDFTALPAGWCCPVCGAAKRAYEAAA